MKRLLTALVLIPVFFYILVFAPPPVFLVALACVGLFCLYEYLGIAAARFPQDESPQRNLVPYAAGLVFLVLPSDEGLFLTLFALLSLVMVMRHRELSSCLPLSSVSVLGVIYIFGSWRCAVGLRSIDSWWVFYAAAINWVGDSFAYYGGRALGRHKLAPRVSPAKSWEGAICSVAASMALGALFLHYRFPAVPLVQALALCFAANVAGQFGDLAESALKRGSGVKDSGTLLPGHGGWLDRVDSTLFSVPVVYWLLSRGWFLP
jgi:phosphatidate cytidylyltransferase